MDPVEPNQSKSDSEIVDSNAHFYVSRDPAGYSVWSSDIDTDDPLASYPLSDEGIERALGDLRKRTSSVRRDIWIPRLLLAFVLASAGVWLIAEILVTMELLLGIRMAVGPAWYANVNIIDQAAERFTFASTAAFVALFLARHWRST